MPFATLLASFRKLPSAGAPVPEPPAKPGPWEADAPLDRPEDDPVDPRDLLGYAAQVADELEQLKAICHEKGRPDLVERLEWEINGYPDHPPFTAPGKIVRMPSSRYIDAQLRGDICGGRHLLPLPYPFAQPTSTTTRLGLRHLQRIPGLADALRDGKTFFIHPHEGISYDLALAFCKAYPGTDYLVVSTRTRIPIANVHQLIDRIAEYGRALAAGADNKPSWW